MPRRVLITGGAGFIGSHVTASMVALGYEVCVADRFTYAGKGRNLAPVLDQITLLIGDLSSGDLAQRCAEWEPAWVIHLAGETHVDRAIDEPEGFIQSNVLGTTRLLQEIWQSGWEPEKIVVYSTDEVFGSTEPGVAFAEDQPYNPSNAYSASKVAVEAVANSFWRTHGLPISIVRPCNTYGPRQHPEKAIPRFTAQALRGEPMTLYNDGHGSRDWLHTVDHASAVHSVLLLGQPGTAYNLAAGERHTDREIAQRIRGLVEEQTGVPQPPPVYVPGRPGHDRHYLMSAHRLTALGWQPRMDFSEAFAATVRWNIDHPDWWDHDHVGADDLRRVPALSGHDLCASL
jgi:dTDP-glucose 4,6-dehydratase